MQIIQIICLDILVLLLFSRRHYDMGITEKFIGISEKVKKDYIF